jgi:hypothetical protein
VCAAVGGWECIGRIRGVANAFLNDDDLVQHSSPLSPTPRRRRSSSLWLDWHSVVPVIRRLRVTRMV